MSKNFKLTNETDAALPDIPFNEIKTSALGPRYELGVIVVSRERIKALNRQYRDMDEATDILSFPISGAEGEIYLCLSEAKKESKKFDRSYENFLAFLFIHGCAHLKGYDHGSTMERIEAKLRAKFGV